jgi:hypothetical protein
MMTHLDENKYLVTWVFQLFHSEADLVILLHPAIHLNSS